MNRCWLLRGKTIEQLCRRGPTASTSYNPQAVGSLRRAVGLKKTCPGTQCTGAKWSFPPCAGDQHSQSNTSAYGLFPPGS
jgi:hypothetical protein